MITYLCRRKSPTKKKRAKKHTSRKAGKSKKKRRNDGVPVVTIDDDSESSDSPSSSSSSSETGERTKRGKTKDKRKSKKRRNRKRLTSTSSSSPDQSSAGSGSNSESEGPFYRPGMSYRGLSFKVSSADRIKLDIMEDSWPVENRPERLRRVKALLNFTVDGFIKVKKQIEKEEERKNLGEEACAKDGMTRTVRYKAKKDDGKKKLHLARWNRQPLVPPEDFYAKVPKKRETVIRNFPMDHYGIASQVPDLVLGHMHNRSVKVSLDSFVKSSYKAAKGNDKAGKFADLFQLLEGIVNYCIVLHALWPADYTGLVLLKVLTEARWGEAAGLTGRCVTSSVRSKLLVLSI
jgi:hypothetical protein